MLIHFTLYMSIKMSLSFSFFKFTHSWNSIQGYNGTNGSEVVTLIGWLFHNYHFVERSANI